MAFFTTALLVISAVSTVKSVQQQQKAAKTQKRALAEQRRKEEQADQRQRRQLAEEARVKRAQAQQAAINQGVGQGSGIQGGLASLQTQLGSNVGFINTQAAFADRISGLNQQAADFRSSAATFGAIGDLAAQGATVFDVPTGSPSPQPKQSPVGPLGPLPLQ